MEFIQEAARIIAENRLSLSRLPALPPEVRPDDLDSAYRVQDALHEKLTPHLGPLVGYKIGCTSEIMQRYLAIPHPCGGALYAKRLLESGVQLKAADFVRLGVECEIAVKMGADLPASGAPYTADTVADAVECYYPAIEFVDDRYVEWETLGAPTLIADDFFSAGLVLGEPVSRSNAPDLQAVVGRALINGVEASRGTGADVLGHPHNPLAWLANHLAARGQMLRKGDTVTVGSVVKTIWLNAGDEARMEFDGLGSVSLKLN
ncbi:2-keto-4-pentenoate hydratase [Variovorax sp. KK3]|uniref:2-keto-4-pentenoate hydratase n=1 Tax=Variovorax sp. KK3 TaxID=1855728 RepID=UPI00097BBC60|nr:fumarylacetoacetate hydrolase family protein [Variovorax sp. KK3]